MVSHYLSPLRYPGAKRLLAPKVGRLLKEYDFTGGVFVEPCCGGASVSLYMLEHKLVSSVILTDLDPWIASFWQMLFLHTEDLLSDIKDIDVTPEVWRQMKATKPQTMREMALYCFFFNRTNYSGILTGGMIGGHAQASPYKIDCRFNKEELLERIRRVADKFGPQVQVREASVFDILDQATSQAGQDLVYYIDPPYVDLKLYTRNFRNLEHQMLKEKLEKLKDVWILSYHDHPKVREMYWNSTPLERAPFSVTWVADRPKPGTELLISNLPLLKNKQPLPASLNAVCEPV